jgi:hypothetical protein
MHLFPSFRRWSCSVRLHVQNGMFQDRILYTIQNTKRRNKFSKCFQFSEYLLFCILSKYSVVPAIKEYYTFLAFQTLHFIIISLIGIAIILPTFELLCLPSFGSYCAIITDISRCYKNNNCHKKETLNYREESQKLRNLIFPYSNFLFNYSLIQPCSRVEITRLTYRFFP